MNTHTKVKLTRILAAKFIVFSLLTINANAFIMVDDAVISAGSPFSDYVLSLSLSIPVGSGIFSIAIDDLGGGQFGFTATGIAEGFSLHSAVYNLAFTPDYVQNDIALLGNMGSNTTETLIIPIDESIFLGYWDDRNLDYTPTSNDNYGWFELQNTAGGLTILDGATAIGGGIYAGTYTQIPEPSTITLVCSGAIAMLLRTRRKHIGRK